MAAIDPVLNPAIAPADAARTARSPARSFSASVITDFASFLQLKTEWDALVAVSAVDHPFLTHDWIRLWLECFGSGRSLHIVVIRENGEIAAIVPLLYDEQGLFGFRMRTLALIWNAHVPRCDFICRDDSSETYSAIWEHLVAERRHWDLLLLPQLPEGSRTLGALQEAAAGSDFLVATQESGAAPYMEISGTWKNYFENLPVTLRSGLRHSAERLTRFGALERECVRPGAGNLGAAMEDAFQMECAVAPSDSHWRLGARSRTFYARLALEPGLRDCARLDYLRSGDRRIAFNLSLYFKGAAYLLRARSLAEFADHAPLHVLASMNLEDCFKEGLRRYDFMETTEDWARRWRCGALSHHWMFIHSNSPRTALFHAMKFNPGPTIEEWTRTHEALGEI
jgi:hypothetical protein